MIASSFDHIAVTGIVGSVPMETVHNEEYADLFGETVVKKLIASTGVRESHCCGPEQNASDLAYAAASHLLEQKAVDPKSIGILVFVGVYSDYLLPANAFVLQKRLGLSTDCIAYDMPLGCSGFIYGLQTVCALLNGSSAQRALLLMGETPSKVASPHDTSRLLFGDGGAAALLEKTAKETAPIRFGLKCDGHRFKSIIVPAGGFRNPDAPRDAVMWADGNIRSDYNLYMNGPEVFSFTMTDVPALFQEFQAYYQTSPQDYDSFFLHQANAFMIRHLAKKVKMPMEKVPLSLDRYGNTGAASVPIGLCDAYGGRSGETLRLMMAGFGVGLSWGVATMQLGTDAVLPVIQTDDYYRDGGVSHD